jgi:hypothetical protein
MKETASPQEQSLSSFYRRLKTCRIPEGFLNGDVSKRCNNLNRNKETARFPAWRNFSID